MGSPAPEQLARPRTARLYAAAAASSVLLWASFFPLSFGFLGWVALVPWLTLVRADGLRRHRYLAAWLGGLIFFVAALQWVRVAHPMMYFAWIGLAIYCSLYFPLALFLIRRLDRRGVPLWLSVPIVWTSLEYLRAHFPTGFSWLEPLGLQHLVGFGWYFLGYTQHDYLPLIQVADLTGVYGLSFVIAAVNALVFLWLQRLSALAPATRPIMGTALTACLLVMTAAYGYWRLDHAPFSERPTVALIQGNLPQEQKNARGETMATHFLRLSDAAAQPSSDGGKPDLIVWPETACPDDWYDRASRDQRIPMPQEREKARRELAAYVAARWHANTLFGLNTIEFEGEQQTGKFNSAVLISDKGIPIDRYDKIHLVPFGEYVPLRSTFPWLQVFTPYKGDYSCDPGREWTRFHLRVGERVYRFAVLICYEDTDPSMARRYALPESKDGNEEPPVDFLVNISNDGWFRGSSEHEEHLAVCRFRAVETRRAVIRAVNMGISGIIDADGRVVRLPAESWAASKAVEAVVRGAVPLDERSSLYARLGDWLPLACWATLALGLVLPLFWRRDPQRGLTPDTVRET
jgi:apolipoprotein N-acyltransferase